MLRPGTTVVCSDHYLFTIGWVAWATSSPSLRGPRHKLWPGQLGLVIFPCDKGFVYLLTPNGLAYYLETELDVV